MPYKQIKNGTFVFASALEITAFPKAELLSKDSDRAFMQAQVAFTDMISEFHKISVKHSTSLEILWLPERIKNQTFHSKPRAFLILRNTGPNLTQLEHESDIVMSNLLTELNRSKFEVEKFDLEQEEFIHLLGTVDQSCHYTTVKQDKIVVGPYTGQPYYTWDTFNYDTEDSLSAFLATLSQCENVAVSFQIIPTSIYPNEQNNLTVLSNTFSQLPEDFSDINCHKVLDSMAFVMERFEKPQFYYNISVFGNRENCKLLSTKIVSLIESGKTKVTDGVPFVLDISREKISLQKHFYVYPWMLNSIMTTKYRDPRINQLPYATALCRMPCLISIDELSSFFRFPLYDKSMPEIQEKRSTGDGEQFSAEVVGENTIKIGNLVTSEGNKVSIGVPFKSWTQHALVVGMPGTGKTTFAVNILTQFAKHHIPFLAIEPTKAEYRAMIDAIDGLQIFTPGNNAVSPFIINPFVPPVGITVEQYTPSLLSAFKAAFAMDGPLEMIFLKAINACYTEYGWKRDSKAGDPGTQPFGMFEYILCFKRIMKTMKYGKETQSNIETAGLLRLMNLIEQNPNIYDTVNTIPIEDLLSKPSVLELNSIENEEQKALIMALLLSSICIYTKINQKGDGKLKNVILIDEAHVLLDSGADSENSGNSKGTTVKTIQKMIAEIRSYGTSIIIADQKPSKVTDDIVANTNVKVSFRLTSPKERNMIAESTDMKESDAEHISQLSIGQAYLYFDKLMSAQLVQTEDTRARDHIRLSVEDKEIAERMTYWNTRREKLMPFRECSCSKVCKECSFGTRNEAEFYASKLINKCADKITEKKVLLGYAAKIPSVLESQHDQFSEEQFKQFCFCTMIRFIRKAELEAPYMVTLQDIEETIKYIERGTSNDR